MRDKKNGPDSEFSNVDKNLLVAHDVEKLAPADVFHDHVQSFGHARNEMLVETNNVFVLQIAQQL